MRYRLEIKEEARQQLRALPKEHRQNIGWRRDVMQTDLVGDVKKLAARTQEYRLRVGSFRVYWKATSSACMQSKTVKKPMSDTTALEKPTLESLALEVRRLQERLEDMEDLMELRAAVERNAGKPGTPWESQNRAISNRRRCSTIAREVGLRRAGD